MIPNFFISEPYLKLTLAECYEDAYWIWIEEREMDLALFPPLPISIDRLDMHSIIEHKNIKVWSDFENLNINNMTWIELSSKVFKFLDYEYIYNPIHFNDLSGGKWEVYRKNIRKWLKSNVKWSYRKLFRDKEMFLLLSDWIERKRTIIEDAEIIIAYCSYGNKIEGIHRKFLYDGTGRLVAINIWDENWHYINYRYVLTVADQPHVDEFARYCFYTDREIQAKGKLVNDGGTLGNEGLERFKDKLNPVKKRKMYSYEP